MPTETFSVGSLFSGIGGLDLAAERGLPGKVAWHVEQNEFCREVLAHRFPDAQGGVTDVREVTKEALPLVDVIVGGFPCQDLSHAGRKAGLAGDASSLGWEFLRVVEDLRPRGVILENTFHRWRAWVPELRRALWRIGYASVPLRVSAGEVGAPHRRARAFVVAYAHSQRLREWPEWKSRRWEDSLRAEGQAEPRDFGRNRAAAGRWPRPPASGVRRVDDGAAERMDFPRRLTTDQERLTALGNAVVPAAGELAAHVLGDLLTIQGAICARPHI